MFYTASMTHTDLIIEAGDIAAISRKLGVPYERVAAWKRSGSIPGKYWAALDRAGLATLEQLAEAQSDGLLA